MAGDAMTIPPEIQAQLERLLRENGLMPCAEITQDCPFCLRKLQRKCPEQSAWDGALELAGDAFHLGLQAQRERDAQKLAVADATLTTIASQGFTTPAELAKKALAAIRQEDSQ